MPMKSTGIAAVLAVLVPGLGHIYLGKITEGIVFLVLGVILGVIGLLTLFLIFLPIVFWIWQIYDAYNKSNQYNASIQQTGRAPW